MGVIQSEESVISLAIKRFIWLGQATYHQCYKTIMFTTVIRSTAIAIGLAITLVA
ncbi:hypothetical protein VZG47_07120 [Synechococcus elongatus IITB5]|uniref:hypothetical protein n=1 Tax=Synechococcus elongatus TaxID=32046 RepID=UPI0030D41AD1